MDLYFETASRVNPAHSKQFKSGVAKRPSQWDRVKESVIDFGGGVGDVLVDAAKSYNVRIKNAFFPHKRAFRTNDFLFFFFLEIFGECNSSSFQNY